MRVRCVLVGLLAVTSVAAAQSQEEIDRLVDESLRHERAGKTEDAIAAMEKALALERRVLGPDHWDVAGSHHRLAELHEKAGAPDTARRHLVEIEAIAVRRDVAWQVTDARQYLADFDRRQRMTPTERRRLGQLKSHDRLKMSLWRRDRYRAALQSTTQARTIVRELWGPRHPEYARKLHELGFLRHELGELSEAETLFRKALALRREILGDDHPLTAESLHNVGSVRIDQGDLREAGPLLERARARYGAARGREDPGYLQILRTLGRYRREAGDLDGAESVLRDALSAASKTFGRRHAEYPRFLESLAKLLLVRGDAFGARPLLAEALARARTEKRAGILQVQLGAAERMLGRYAEAEAAVSKGLARLRVGVGEGNPLYATALNEQALIEHARGRPGRALEILEKARTLLAPVVGTESPNYAVILANLAAMHDALGDFERAHERLAEARAILRAAYGPDHPRCAATLLNTAAHYRASGNYVGAVPLAEEAVSVWQRAVGERHPLYLVALSNLGEIYRAAGDYDRAAEALETCVATAPAALHDGAWLVACLNNLGGLLVERNDLERAEAVLDDALARARKLGADHPSQASVLDNRATLYRATGDVAAAVRDYNTALALLKKSHGFGHPHVARTLQLLAATHLDAGEIEAAVPLVAQAGDIAREASGDTHPARVEAFLAEARLRNAQGAHAAERTLLQRVVEIRRTTRGDGHPYTVDAVRRLALATLADGDRDEAATLLDAAKAAGGRAFGEAHPGYADLLEAEARVRRDRAAALLREAVVIRRRHLNLPLPERRLLAMAARLRATLHAYVDAETDCDAYGEVLHWKGAVFARQRRGRPAPDRADDLAALERARRDLSALALAPPAPGQRGGWLRRVADARARVDEAERNVADGDAVDEVRHPSTTLPADHVLVDYLVYGSKLAAFVTRRGAPTRRVELGAVEPVAAAVDAWRRAIGADAKDAATRGATLTRMTWTPLAPHVGDARLVLVSPDGPLNRVPFAALPDEEGRPLIDDVAVRLVTAPRLLGATAAGPPRTTQGLLLVGDVDFGKGRWATLPGTAKEVANIARLFRTTAPGLRVTRLTRAAATKSAFRAAAGRHRYVHCATHGFLAPPRVRSALRNGGVGWHPGALSGIVFAGADVLTAGELAALDLAGVDLLVLSACETGDGESAGGEGVVGLMRAGRIAGARRVVGSLWRVEDARTRDFMTRFYRHLWTDGATPVAALRATQRALIAAGVPPRHWAAWVLS